jgi:hypothetical protein
VTFFQYDSHEEIIIFPLTLIEYFPIFTKVNYIIPIAWERFIAAPYIKNYGFDSSYYSTISYRGYGFSIVKPFVKAVTSVCDADKREDSLCLEEKMKNCRILRC